MFSFNVCYRTSFSRVDSDDDEAEVEADEEARESEQQGPPEEAMSEDRETRPVKPEPTEPSVPPPSKGRQSRHELAMYNSEELALFKKKELLADVAFLDGKSSSTFTVPEVNPTASLSAEQVKNANPNLSVLKEYKKREQEFLSRAKDLEEVTALRDAQKAKYDGLRKQRLDEFMTGFNMISAKLKEMYQVRSKVQMLIITDA